MTKRYRDLTHKYRAIRLQPDALYLSHPLQTLFNKFTKDGKKAFARRQLTLSLCNYRTYFRRPRMFNALLRVLQQVSAPLALINRRVGRNVERVPVPVRRNKQETISIHTFYRAVCARDARPLSARCTTELVDISVTPRSAATLREKTILLQQLYENRVNLEHRWK